MCISVLVVGLPVKVGLAQAQHSSAPHRTAPGTQHPPAPTVRPFTPPRAC